MKGASLIAPFGLRMPESLKNKIADRAKANGRSMNAEIVQILQETIDTDRAIAESDLVDFDSTQAAFNAAATAEDKEKFLSDLAKKDPFTADILREGEEHARRLAAILGRRMGYLDDEK
ncbi:TPA: Arc family DNA-binding protein [Citrobacter koseri]|uniref:Arc family DNA-binding protein n=1 Tax=Citrobacter koseri TaxID=545 RepID=UPI000E1896C2|nr:Arc family DNA-binding protein [Citrobacter koseri]MBJ8763703.1 Arc family DNA-binding protein [Citrobacter koseri]MBJ9229050.1 Arc family DNA-binding protein [Citrobacter koseri]SUX61353.1 Arc-like DNA binding domain [Citrobacter koseri]SUX97455.1 Arc-like DNA binding domain [Citrobacter koseri]HEM6679551.1 Arc family DNA-binding protein [Citrobacter koseri]